MTGEKWLPVVGASDYRISDHGRVLSFRRRYPLPRFLTLLVNYEGYRYLEIVTDEGMVRHVRVHVLVLEAFVGPCPPAHQTRHLDGDPANNHVSNLRWGTGSENTFDNVRNGTHRNARKTHCVRGHPFDEENTRVRTQGNKRTRECLACRGGRSEAGPIPPGLPGSRLTPLTHCQRGHEFTEENTWHKKAGGRECLACRTAWRAAYNAARRERRAAGLPSG